MALIAAAAAFPAVIGAEQAPAGSDCLPVPATSELGGRAPVTVAVEALLSSGGEQIGRQIAFEARRGARVTVNLPAESFVAGPFADRLLYGFHMPTSGSDIRALSLESGCDVRLAQPSGIVRSAILDESGQTLYVHTVTDGERRDGGVTRVNVATGDEQQVLEPLAPDEAFGRIFATRLAFAEGQSALIAQSCGRDACITRVLNDAAASVVSYAKEHGELVGMTGDELIAFEPEHGRPAALLAIDLHTGGVRTLADEVYAAELSDGQLLIETPAGWQEVLR